MPFTHGQPRATSVDVHDDKLVVTLVDGRIISVPLSWFPRLLRAIPTNRDAWCLMGDGEGIHWPALDEDISVEGLLSLSETGVAADRRERQAPTEHATETPGTDAAHPSPAGTYDGLPWGEHLTQEYADPHRIALEEVGGGRPYCGLIVPASSGYRIVQKTGGLGITYRELEGLYVPLPSPDLAYDLGILDAGCGAATLDDDEHEEAYRAAHADEVAKDKAWVRERHWGLAVLRKEGAARELQRGITSEQANQLDHLLQRESVPLSVDHEKLARSTEAWVWVRIAGNVRSWKYEYRGGYRFQGLLAALSGRDAILTWKNCD